MNPLDMLWPSTWTGWFRPLLHAFVMLFGIAIFAAAWTVQRLGYPSPDLARAVFWGGGLVAHAPTDVLACCPATVPDATPGVVMQVGRR